MISNYQHNKRAIDDYRKRLKAMLGDISDIDVRILNISVNKGLIVARRNTPVVTGFMRKMWGVTPTKKVKRKGAEKGLCNTADYASFVNDGHRQEVGRYVPAIGKRLVKPWVEGQHQLEAAERAVEKSLKQEFVKEIERVNRKYDK
jgi:hypothetical protein